MKLELQPHSLGNFLIDHRKKHLKHLSAYFGDYTVCIPSEGARDWSGYAGRFFEHYSALAAPTTIDGSDLAALACLSVDVDHRLAASVASLQLRFQECFGRLADFSRDTRTWDVDESHFIEGAPLHDLWNLLVSIDGVKTTKASKLMASKFPHLLPVIDKKVRDLVHAPNGYWIGWNRVLKTEVKSILEDLHTTSGLSSEVSLLRTADVCLWMWDR